MYYQMNFVKMIVLVVHLVKPKVKEMAIQVCISNLRRWRGGAIGRSSDLQFIGHGFESCPGTIAQWS